MTAVEGRKEEGEDREGVQRRKRRMTAVEGMKKDKGYRGERGE